MWTIDHDVAISSFVNTPGVRKVIMYMDPESGLICQTNFVPPLRKVKSIQYFLKARRSKQPLRIDNIESQLQYGVMNGTAMDSLLNVMSGMYLPMFLSNHTWPEGVRKECSGYLHKFMATLTETANDLKNQTVLYLPEEPLSDMVAASKDKDLVQQLETTVLHWTRQIKEVVGSQETSYQTDNASLGPLHEIEFWRLRTQDLNGIKKQLDRQGVRDILQVLRLAQSTYLAKFDDLYHDIDRGSTEAKNNLKFLSTLEDSCKKLAEAKPHEIPALLPDVINRCRFIWSLSKYYNVDDRMTGLLSKISNQIIIQCSKTIKREEIFSGDVETSMRQLRYSIEAVEFWKMLYHRTREAIAAESARDPSIKPWSFDPAISGIFAQIPSFKDRCNNLQEVCEGQLQFARKYSAFKLAKGERAPLPIFGGTRGAEIEGRLIEIEDAFEKHVSRLRDLKYDALNAQGRAVEWDRDYAVFKAGLKDLEVRMSNVISTAWNDISTIKDGIYLLDVFHHLAVRTAMKETLISKTDALYEMFLQNLKQVKKEFDDFKKNPPLAPDQPKWAGAALWAQGLLSRIEADYKLLQEAEAAWSQKSPQARPHREDAETTFKQYSQLLQQWILGTHAEWKEEVDAMVAASGPVAAASPTSPQALGSGEMPNPLFERLNRPLIAREVAVAHQDGVLKRTPTIGRLECNFDKQLLRLFGEVRYWYKTEHPIAYLPFDIYSKKCEQLHSVRESVCLIVRDYNAIIDCLSVEERKLFSEHLRRLDTKINPGITKLTWNSRHIKDNFVRFGRQMCADVLSTVMAFKEHKQLIKQYLQSITKAQLFDIEKNQLYDHNTFAARQAEHHKKVKLQLAAVHAEIVAIFNKSYAFFAESQGRDTKREWIRYVRKTDAAVESALRRLVKRGMQDLARAVNGDGKSGHPIFKVSMLLQDGVGVAFSPSMPQLKELVFDIAKNARECVNVVSKLADVLESAQITFSDAPRGVKFDEVQSPTAAAQLSPTARGHAPLSPGKSPATSPSAMSQGMGSAPFSPTNLQARLQAEAAATALAVKNRSFVATISKDDEINKILASLMHGSDVVEAEMAQFEVKFKKYDGLWKGDKSRSIADDKQDALKNFELEINRYKETEKSILAEETTYNPEHCQFISIDSKPIQEALVRHSRQWVDQLNKQLAVKAVNELLSLHSMFTNLKQKLSQTPMTIDQLETQMKLLQELRGNLPSIEARFRPMEDSFALLDKFDIATPERERELLDGLRHEWAECQSTIERAQDTITARKVDMRKDLDDAIVAYNQQATDIRAEFKEHGPFSAPGPGQGDPDVHGAFAFLDEYKRRLAEARRKAVDMHKGMRLFSIEIEESKDIAETERELQLLEKVWIMFRQWLDHWVEWKSTTFGKIDVAELDKTSLEFSQNLGKMGRTVKGWKVWKALSDTVGLFRTTLPLIAALRHPAMRARHWEKIMGALNTKFDPESPTFTLDRLFALEIHNFGDIINDVSTVAARELAMENAIKDIKTVWTFQTLDMGVYKTKYIKLGSVSDLNDLLEKHQLAIGGMKGSPYYPHFKLEVDHWFQTLNSMSEALEMIIQVQRQWMYLESIFVDSLAIREQLPGETRAFNQVNKRWDTMTRSVYETKLVSKLIPLYDELSDMSEALEKINKHLSQYLETKRRAFPRFYFLSDDDLLEVLGNAKDPVVINRHVRKCFMNIKKLIVDPDPSEKKPEPADAPRGGKRKDAVVKEKKIEVVGVMSAEDEVLMIPPVLIEGEVENWLAKVQAVLRKTLQKTLVEVVRTVDKDRRKARIASTIVSTLGQYLILGGQTFWTANCERDLQPSLEVIPVKALKKLKHEWDSYIRLLAGLVRSAGSGASIGGADDASSNGPAAAGKARDVASAGPAVVIDAKSREKIIALLTIEVHSRDVIERLRAAAKIKPGIDGFEWQSQLRFYMENDLCTVRQTNTQFDYGYEYQGNNGRLVITPLTDRCYMTLTTALSLARGGSPSGPAGTGKTETVKDLGKGLGKQVVVTNCSPNQTVESVARDLSGLAQTGAWGCFDEFNRILIEVLSVVALHVACLFDAIRDKKDFFELAGETLKIDRSVGVFITMNPGYAGRTELPDNLKSLFRPVAMMVPDAQNIAEIMLLSEGFRDANTLAKKIVTIYELMTQQFSKQPQYSYGLRAIKSVLSRAGEIYRNPKNTLSEDMVLCQSIRDMNAAKLVKEDIFLFENLIGDLFINLELPPDNQDDLIRACKEVLLEKGMQIVPYQIEQTVQLHKSKGTRHSNMLVGGTMSGKTVSWQTLAEALGRVPGKQPVEVHIVNPKSVSDDQLFGCYHPITKEWQPGILSTILKRACEAGTPKEKWLMMDGPVDTLWIESMNSVMDDNKVLTLVNGDRITLPPEVSLLFEVLDLAQASPATVSRVGIVFYDELEFGWRPLVNSWLQAKLALVDNGVESKNDGPPSAGGSKAPSIFTKEAIETIAKLFDKYVVPSLKFKAEQGIKDAVYIPDVAAVASLLRLFDSLATLEHGVDPQDENGYLRLVEMWFVFCTIWSVGGVLDGHHRPRFDHFFRDIEAQFPPVQSVFDYYVDHNKKDWLLWEQDKVNNAWKPPPNTPFSKLLVPTVDTVRMQFLINALLVSKYECLVTGATGTGKTSIIRNILDQTETLIDPNAVAYVMNFSSATTPQGVQQQLETRIEKRQRPNYGPRGGKSRLIVYVDDLNMPKKDEFGAVGAIELLRHFLTYRFWYDAAKLFKKRVLDVQMVASMGATGGARSDLTPRFQSRFNVFAIPFPEDGQVKRIFRSLLNHHFNDFDEASGIKTLGASLTQGTLDIYKAVVETFLPTPAKCHYMFNLRDMSKVTEGLLRCDTRHYDSRESVLRLWIHELNRVFADRLVDQSDVDKFTEIVSAKLASTFDISWKKLFKEDNVQPMFGDFLDDAPLPAASASHAEIDEDFHPYQDLTFRREKVKAHLEEALADFNRSTPFGTPKMDLVMFQTAIEHVTRIYRILTAARGSALLVGMGGSGRQSAARLASHVAEMFIMEITARANYKLSDFREDLKILYRQTGVDCKPTVFLIPDTQINDEAILEDINNILGSGEVTNLFPPEELLPILDGLRTDAMKEGRSVTQDGLYDYFIERVRGQLHVVFCMSPVGASYRNRCRMFPALISNTTIDWFSRWPPAALQEVAAHFLRDVDVAGPKTKESLASVFMSIHQSGQMMSDKMMMQLKRQNYITPTKYLDLVVGYKVLLASKRFSIGALADKLHNGLEKLDESRIAVRTMTEELTTKQKDLKEQEVIGDKLLQEIVTRKAAVAEQKAQLEIDTRKTQEEAKDLEGIQKEAAEELEKVLPALRKAMDALEKLDRNAVTEVKSYPKPPMAVERVMSAIMILLQKETSWASAKKELADPGFLQRLKEFDKNNISNATLKAVGKYTKFKDFNPDDISSVSVAAGAMSEWVLAMEQYAKVFRDVEPRRNALRKAEEDMASKRAQLAEKEVELAEVLKKMVALEESYEKSEEEKRLLKEQATQLELKLQRAHQLVESLSGERTRWEASIDSYTHDMKNLVGDVVIAAAFLVYAGPFTSDLRADLIKSQWMPAVAKFGLPQSVGFEVSKFLASTTDIMDWNIQGLPSDSFSSENGVLVVNGIRWPYCIDPQAQANMWIKAKESSNNLQVCDFHTDNFIRLIENAVIYGWPVLLQDVAEDLDPILEPLFRISRLPKAPGVNAARVESLKLGDRELAYNPEFKLYLTTKLQNPSLGPEVSTKTTVINFAVKEKGLQDQLLGIVVQREDPALEEQRASLTRTISDSKRKLIELEDLILTSLKSSDGNLLDNHELIRSLQNSKVTSEQLKVKLALTTETEASIDQAREGYRSVAVRSALCFFVVSDLGRVDPMYQFSLKNYVDLFKKSIQDSKKKGMDDEGQDLLDRIQTLNDYHTEAVYKYVQRGLFEKHKLLFTFQLAVRKINSDAEPLDLAEWEFFLRGGLVLDRKLRAPIPEAVRDFMSEEAWDNITELDKLPTFRNLAASFETEGRAWRQYFYSEAPEKIVPPGAANWVHKKKGDDFSHMLVLRCLRPDRVVFAARLFIGENLGPQYVQAPPLDLKDIYKVSDPQTPIIFVLSPGVDPLPNLRSLAADDKIKQTVKVLALGQGQAPIAEKLLAEGVQQGNWVFLANVHLSQQWLPRLEKMIEAMQFKKPHPQFRLWLSSDPTDGFPISLLQSSLKLTTEPPKGIKANMLRLYQSTLDPQHFVDQRRSTEKYKRMVFSLCFFHAVLLERRKFLSLGWNIPYDFGDSDFVVSENLLRIYLESADESTPWDALKYLVGMAIYGGRVTDPLDRRLLKVYMDNYFREEALTTANFKLSSLDTYYIPEDGDLEDYIKAIQRWPNADGDLPEAFGQHPNADIASQTTETKTLLDTVLSLQPRVVADGAKGPDEVVMDLIVVLKDQVPPRMDAKAIAARLGDDHSPLTTVLLQEIDRYNVLLDKCHRSLDDLRKGIKGEVVISAELENMFDSLYDQKVPKSWSFAYKSLKPLGAWVRDLGERIMQLRRWADKGPPRVFWLSGFTFPTGFLTALMQVFSRSVSVPIHMLTWEFSVLPFDVEEDSMKDPPKDGALVRGLFLEGAKWDGAAGCLTDASPLELVSSMPIIHFKPVEARKKQPKGVYQTPLYVYPIRTGTREVPSFMIEVDLKVGQHDPNFWTKRGTALLLSLDR